MIYERYHTRDIHKVGGLGRQMPWMAFFLVFFTLSSIGLPGLNGFVSEFLVLFGTAMSATQYDGMMPGPLGFAFAIPAATGIMLGAVYMLWMCRRVLFGPLVEPPHTPDLSNGLKKDLTGREIGVLVPIALCCVFIGVFPKPVQNEIDAAVRSNIMTGRSVAQPDLALDADAASAIDSAVQDRGPATRRNLETAELATEPLSLSQDVVNRAAWPARQGDAL